MVYLRMGHKLALDLQQLHTMSTNLDLLVAPSGKLDGSVAPVAEISGTVGVVPSIEAHGPRDIGLSPITLHDAGSSYADLAYFTRRNWLFNLAPNGHSKMLTRDTDRDSRLILPGSTVQNVISAHIGLRWSVQIHVSGMA